MKKIIGWNTEKAEYCINKYKKICTYRIISKNKNLAKPKWSIVGINLRDQGKQVHREFLFY